MVGVNGLDSLCCGVQQELLLVVVVVVVMVVLRVGTEDVSSAQ
jgi:hypothetical protein